MLFITKRQSCLVCSRLLYGLLYWHCCFDRYVKFAPTLLEKKSSFHLRQRAVCNIVLDSSCSSSERIVYIVYSHFCSTSAYHKKLQFSGKPKLIYNSQRRHTEWWSLLLSPWCSGIHRMSEGGNTLEHAFVKFWTRLPHNSTVSW